MRNRLLALARVRSSGPAKPDAAAARAPVPVAGRPESPERLSAPLLPSVPGVFAGGPGRVERRF